MIQSHSSRATAPAIAGLASWYTPGLADGFGDRLLMFDNTETESLELLRFYPSLTNVAGFEEALHERVRQVGRIPDHAFPLIVAVERLDGDGALALVSTHTPGKRLSAFFERPGPRKGLNPAFVTGMITQVIQALTVLQAKGDGIAHCALTADRVVLSNAGRVCVIEHVLGSALTRLNPSAAQLWREFGLVAPTDSSGVPRLDARADVYQLAVLGLELLLGRRLTPQDVKDRLPDLLAQWSSAALRMGLATDRLLVWLERALQIGERPYGSAAEACADLRDIPAESTVSAFDQLPPSETGGLTTRTGQPTTPANGQGAHMANASRPDDHTLPDAQAPARPALVASESRWEERFPPEPTPAAPGPRLMAPGHAEPSAAATPSPPVSAAPRVKSGPRTAATAPAPLRTMLFRAPRVSPWIAAGLGLVALVEAIVIAALLLRQPQEVVVSAAAKETPIVQTPPLIPDLPPPDASVATPATLPASADADSRRAEAAERAIANAQRSQQTGGIRVTAPVPLTVLQGDRVLGSTADGLIVAPSGTHQLVLVNPALGVRIPRAVTFRAGQVTALDIPVPPGRVSVNAQPWAEVFIDNRSFGETPLANLSVPVGEHEIVFRHPELGERRQTITVRGDQTMRVSTTFEK